MEVFMRALALIPLLVLSVSCTKDEVVDTSPPEDTDPGIHPNVPEGYELFWNTEGCGDDGDQTQVYIIAEGSISEDGQSMTGTEKWYWFFGGDRSEDCIDTFEFNGSQRLTSSQLEQFSASQAEAGFAGTYKKTENNCPGMNYYATWGHNGEDGFEYGDEISANMALIFDYLTPNGALNWENKALVYAYVGDSTAWTWGDTSYDPAGVFTPTGDDPVGPPADITWEPSFCFGTSE
jgi:hypothetical protein